MKTACQKISNFTTTEAPITAVLLIEAASANYYFYGDALQAAFSFANSLKKEDWTAVVSYDISPASSATSARTSNPSFRLCRSFVPSC